MPRTLVICEKPSQARAIMKAVGKEYGDVLSARGHILTLKTPDDVRDEWKSWTTDLLWPGKFYDKKPVSDTRSLLTAIKDKAKSAERIIIATDCDREGQLIGGEIVDYIGFKGEVLRAIFNAEDPKSLREAFAKARPNSEFAGLYAAGQAREQADQISNLSLTRTATVILKAPGQKGAIGIGRVKSPVLGIVCRRELEIEGFKPQDLFEIDADVAITAGELVLTCSRLPFSLVQQEAAAEGDDAEEELDEALAEEENLRGRIMKKEIAEALSKVAKGFKGPVKSNSRRAKQSPPKLFDLTALQSAASARFNWSGEKTLGVAQKLYADHTLITYPRAESKYLPENNIGDVPRLLSALLGIPDFRKHEGLLETPEVRRGKAGHFSNKALEGMSHYAIIPNVNTAGEFRARVSSLPADESKLFDMIAKQYMAALAPDYEYRQTTVSMLLPWKGHDWDFRTIGRVPLVPGWRAILGGGGKDAEIELPDIKDGEAGEILDARLRTVTTRPPARYSEGSLIKVMQEAWRLVEDPKMRAKLKETRGIGTPATRAEVVKGLLKQGQITTIGKSIAPTTGGMALYKTLNAVCPNVVDPGRTAAWESLFEFVEKGRLSAEDAVEKILASTRTEISRIVARKGEVEIETGGKSKPSPAMVKAAKSIAERMGISLPRGASSDNASCRKFLDEHMPKREPGAGGGYPPSEKQLSFAQSLADATKSEIPEAAITDSKALSAWIDKVKDKAPARPPSEKQLAFAERLADEKGVDLPDDVTSDMKACSAFIDAQMGNKPSGSKRPSSSGKRRSSPSSSPSP